MKLLPFPGMLGAGIIFPQPFLMLAANRLQPGLIMIAIGSVLVAISLVRRARSA